MTPKPSARTPIIQARPEYFYHYTCKHGHDTIGPVGNIVPLKRLLTTNVLDEADETTRLIASYAWFTSIGDITKDTAYQIGLDRKELGCKRWEYRYRVSTRLNDQLVPWSMTSLTWPQHIVTAMETSTPGLKPETWYTSQHMITAFYEPDRPKSAGWAAFVSDPARRG